MGCGGEPGLGDEQTGCQQQDSIQLRHDVFLSFGRHEAATVAQKPVRTTGSARSSISARDESNTIKKFIIINKLCNLTADWLLAAQDLPLAPCPLAGPPRTSPGNPVSSPSSDPSLRLVSKQKRVETKISQMRRSYFVGRFEG